MKMPRGIKPIFTLIMTLLLIYCATMNTVEAVSTVQRPTLIFGDDSHYPPFSYLNERGEPAGFNVEIARAAAAAMGYDVIIRLDDWNSVREALKNGEIHAIAGMAYSEERKQFFSFSSKYLMTSGDIFTKRGVEIRDIQELKNQNVVVERGDFVGEYLKSLDINIRLVEVPSVKDALLAIQNGKYLYAGIGTLSGLYTIKKEKISGITQQGINFAARDRCMAVNKDNEDLLLTLNAGLQVIKATGEYEKIYDQFLAVYEDDTFADFFAKYRYAIVGAIVSILALICIALILNQLVKTRTNSLRKANDALNGKQLELESLITDLKSLEVALSAERNLFKTTLHSLGDGVISTDKDGNIHLMNLVAEELTGWKNTEAKGLPFESVFFIFNEYNREICPNPVELVFHTGSSVKLANHTMLVKKNGEEIPIEDSAAPIKDDAGNTIGVVLVFRDITDKREKLEKIKYLSHHDQLTTLYNRHYFEEQFKLLDIEDSLPLTVVMADVNGLKLTNDAFGHKAGDELLKKVAKILINECRSSDIVARIGGDEFVILLPKTTQDETEKIINRYHNLIKEERQDNLVISVSFGWETKETNDQDISEVFAKAEEHMYRKKLVESQSMRNQAIKAIMQTLHEANKRERVHSEKVSQISRIIGEAMQLENDDMKELETAALMHDIGKVAINENVLNKEGILSESEYEEIKRHPEIGYHILKSVDAYTNLADHVLSHHERWDGSGYPRGLSGENISLVARIIAVADAVEAMTGERPYRASIHPNEAMEEIKQNSGMQFDPSVVDALINANLMEQL